MKCKIVVTIVAVVAIALLGGCGRGPVDTGYGWLKLTNSSLNTVQKILVDGVNYGTLDPGDSQVMKLAVGEHEFQQVGISGGTGCSAATVIIVESDTTGFSCSS